MTAQYDELHGGYYDDHGQWQAKEHHGDDHDHGEGHHAENHQGGDYDELHGGYYDDHGQWQAKKHKGDDQGEGHHAENHQGSDYDELHGGYYDDHGQWQAKKHQGDDHDHGKGHDHGKNGHDDYGHDKAESVFSPKVERLLNKILGEETVKNAEEFYFADVKALPGLEANGKVLLAFDDDTDTLTVAVAARDIEANMPHLQHIHGFTDNITDSKSPTLAQDDDGDGFVELAEGLETYGPILVNLTSPPGSGLSGFPVADDNGTYFFRETYQLPTELLPANPQLTLREIVLHGQTLEEGQGSNGGEADGTAGFKVVLPVASGEIQNLTALDDVGFLRDMNKVMKQTDGGVNYAGGGGEFEHHHDFAHG